MTEDFYYTLDDRVLHLSSNPDGKFTVSTRVDSVATPDWPWTHNPDITKVVIEDRIAPTTCEGMFMYLPCLTEIEGLENLDTGKVEDMSHMFEGCRYLKSLDLSNWDTSNVTDMPLMFDGCRSLKSLDLSSFDTSNVTAMSFVFEGCESITSLDLSGWGMGSVYDMTGMFDGCKSLTSLDLSGWDTSHVTYMHDMFAACESLETVTTNDQRIISGVSDHTTVKVVEPTTAADRKTSPSLEATISQFSATADALQAAVTALQGNIAAMRETLGSDPR